MVISLTDQCLITIRDALEAGVPLPVHRLPPNLRQPILDVILMHGTINNPSCLAILSSAEFLYGLTSLDTQLGCTEDNEYLERIATSMATVSPSGETIGAEITKLSLNLYGNLYHDCSFPFIQKGEATNLHGAIRLIAQCPKLKKLEMRLIKEFVYTMGMRMWNNSNASDDNTTAVTRNLFFQRPSGSGVLNRVAELDSCLNILENITELSLTGYNNDGCMAKASFLTDSFPVIEFKRLAVLHVSNCKMDRPAWFQLLRMIGGTLTDLQVKNVELVKTSNGGDGDGILLPPLPQLQVLTLESQPPRIDDRVCNVEFIQNLKACPKLQLVSLGINQRSSDENGLTALRQLPVAFRIKLSQFFGFNNTYGELVFDNECRFQAVAMLGDKIENIRLYMDRWDPRLTAALKHVVVTCKNLVSFCLVMENGIEDIRDSEAVRSALAILFGDRQRAVKLRELTLIGKFLNDDAGFLSLVFENCINLDYLFIGGCRSLRDAHLIEWVRLGGGQLQELCLQECRNITDEGLIPVLKNSGGRLKRFELHFRGDGVTDRTYRTLIEYCRNVKRIRPRPSHLHDLFCSKLFNRLGE